MKKITYLLTAGGIAGVFGYFTGCFCSCGESETSWAVAGAFALIAGIIGFIVGCIADAEEKKEAEEAYFRYQAAAAQRAKEQKERQEQQRRQEEERRFKDWSNGISSLYKKIENNIDFSLNPEQIYAKINSEYDISKLSKRQVQAFETMKKNHILFLKNELYNYLRSEFGYSGLSLAVKVMECLIAVEIDVEANRQAAKILCETWMAAKKKLCYISFSNYGSCDLEDNLERDKSRMEAEASEMLEATLQAEQLLKDGKKDIISAIIQNLSPELIEKQCALMWYYAAKKPFDVVKFEAARNGFMSHTAAYYQYEKLPDGVKAVSYEGEDFKLVAIGKVEEVLARTYSKNQIGGKTTVNQEKGYINLWLDRRIEKEDFEDCYALASGFAWMELYELELDVLRKLVSADVQLPAELQERLSFLESGGTSDIKLYEIEDSPVFSFDNASVEWKASDFAVLFRKMAMKKTRINYSLLISKWTKTLPLSSGQKISSEHINSLLEDLVADFDNKIHFKVTDASAINMANVQYKDAVLFKFVGDERTRCISVLFSYEKFGRNLNLSILTLFTPESGMALEESEKYCLAIKDNVYVDSFRESILQVVDESIKVKQSVYDDENSAPRKKAVFADDDE